jgi:hypothetical protein
MQLAAAHFHPGTNGWHSVSYATQAAFLISVRNAEPSDAELSKLACSPGISVDFL